MNHKKDVKHSMLRLEDLTPKQINQMKKLTARRRRHRLDLPPINMCINVRFTQPSEADADAIRTAATDATRRCGPRHGVQRRADLALSKSDIDMLQKLEPDMLNFINASKENAVLFAANPIAALKQMGDKVDGRILKKLGETRRRLAKAPPPTKARISSITVEVPKDQSYQNS